MEKSEFFELRATDLELFIRCPWKFKLKIFDKIPFSADDKALRIGTLFHLSRQSKELAMELLDSLKLRLPDYIKAKCLINTPNPEEEGDERTVVWEPGLNISYEDQKVFISGHPDRIKKSISKSQYIIEDFKSADSEWKGDIFQENRQWHIYGAMLSRSINLKSDEKIVFRYHVYEKKPSAPVPVRTYSKEFTAEECQNITENAVNELRIALSLNIFEKRPGKQCFYCPYRQICL